MHLEIHSVFCLFNLKIKNHTFLEDILVSKTISWHLLNNNTKNHLFFLLFITIFKTVLLFTRKCYEIPKLCTGNTKKIPIILFKRFLIHLKSII